jgi:hypothetical protein
MVGAMLAGGRGGINRESSRDSFGLRSERKTPGSGDPGVLEREEVANPRPGANSQKNYRAGRRKASEATTSTGDRLPLKGVAQITVFDGDVVGGTGDVFIAEAGNGIMAAFESATLHGVALADVMKDFEEVFTSLALLIQGKVQASGRGHGVDRDEFLSVAAVTSSVEGVVVAPQWNQNGHNDAEYGYKHHHFEEAEALLGAEEVKGVRSGCFHSCFEF